MVVIGALAVSACRGDIGLSPGTDAGAGIDTGVPGDSAVGQDVPEVDAGVLLATTTHTYAASDAIISNPERGFYHTSHLATENDYTWAVEDGTRLIYADVRLDDYRASAIPSSLLDDASRGFGLAREAGAKIILRFAYNEGPYPDTEPDASLAWIEAHLASFGPVIRENADVLAVMQAGFIGAWGEWHSSTNGLTTPENEEAVLNAILAELPADRMTQIRTPTEKGAIYGDSPLTLADAWTSTAAARIGHHNDCFVSSEDDVGTYPSDEVEMWKNYVAQETLYTPMGGETCDPFPARSSCEPTLEEMERLHFTYINADYHPDIVEGWENEGCRDDMERRLGYRLVLIDADLPTSATRGAPFRVRVRLRNDGFAAPINPRPVAIELSVGSTRHSFTFDGIDPRRWLPGEEVVLERIVVIPADLPAGDVTFALALRDAAEALRDDARYSIQTANDGTWDASTGTNELGTVP